MEKDQLVESCHTCHIRAMKHGGKIIAEIVDNIRHWRPGTYYYINPLNKKRTVYKEDTPIFCTQEIDIKEIISSRRNRKST